MLRKIISPILVGHLLEWYDFALYGFLAPVIPGIFLTCGASVFCSHDHLFHFCHWLSGPCLQMLTRYKPQHYGCFRDFLRYQRPALMLLSRDCFTIVFRSRCVVVVYRWPVMQQVCWLPLFLWLPPFWCKFRFRFRL